MLEAIPPPLHYLVLALAGGLLGRGVNLAVCRLEVPWLGARAQAAGQRRGTWFARLPIVGPLAGAADDGRPLRWAAVELGLALALPVWFAWEVEALGLWTPDTRRLVAEDRLRGMAQWQFAAHVILLAFMLAASLVDLDERIIPDSVVVPGTLAGLALALACPDSLLPAGAWIEPQAEPLAVSLRLSSPLAMPARLAGPVGLGLGLAIYLAWCAALLPRRWYGRHGFRRAWGLLAARVVRDPYSRRVLKLALGGSAAIVVGWMISGARWDALLTALVGLAGGGGLIWAVRLIGQAALGREAMGFGDVTLVAMIGGFLGWQAALLIFFIAPIYGLVLGIGQLVLHRENEIPYGPFLCLGAVSVTLAWAGLWQWSGPLFALGFFVPSLMLACLALLGLLLGLWRGVLRLAGRG